MVVSQLAEISPFNSFEQRRHQDHKCLYSEGDHEEGLMFFTLPCPEGPLSRLLCLIFKRAFISDSGCALSMVYNLTYIVSSVLDEAKTGFSLFSNIGFQ